MLQTASCRSCIAFSATDSIMSIMYCLQCYRKRACVRMMQYQQYFRVKAFYKYVLSSVFQNDSMYANYVVPSVLQNVRIYVICVWPLVLQNVSKYVNYVLPSLLQYERMSSVLQNVGCMYIMYCLQYMHVHKQYITFGASECKLHVHHVLP